jgi:hypothetical protein
VRPLFQTATNVLSKVFMNNNMGKISNPPISFIELLVPNASTLRDNSIDV